jgi:myo-inositol-1(or 4)-monophosphatase
MSKPLSLAEKRRALSATETVAREVGTTLRRALSSATKRVNEATQHDIKLELDVRSQKTIERALTKAFPDIAVLGEEGDSGDTELARRWVVDPIDGTVNFAYGIPHACVSIALQERRPALEKKAHFSDDAYATVTGMVYDPFLDEMWTAIDGQPARLNGRKIRVANRKKLDEAIIAMGFAKYEDTLAKMLPLFNLLIHRVRKVRLLGAAALSMTWTANGRLDAYKESGVRLWDIAAGGLIVECAGGEFWRRQLSADHTYEICVSNGAMRKQIDKAIAAG